MVQSAEISPSPSRQSPQAQFVAALGGRVAALQEALAGLETEPYSVVRRSTLRRRLEAIGEAAGVLGFDAAANAFGSAEEVLAQSSDGVSAQALSELRATLALVPSLVPDDPDACAPDSSALGAMRAVTVIALGLVAGQAKLKRVFSGAPQLSLHFTVELEDAATLVDKYVPDLVLLDGRRVDLNIALQALSPLSVCVVVEADLARKAELTSYGALLVFAPGARYEDVLFKAVEAVDAAPGLAPAPAQQDYSVESLVDEMAEDLRQGLIGDMRRGDPSQSFHLNSSQDVKSALWGAVARVRGLVHEQTGGSIAYSAAGPDGAILVGGEKSGRGTRGNSDPSSLRRRRVLVVDDDPAIAWFLSSVLRSAGATVIEASDGLQAWEIAQRELPDLVISDMTMPGLDGFGLCRNLKRDVALCDVPVVLLSCKAELLQRVRELGVGADGYLAKEADAPEILERCAEALRSRSRIETRLCQEETVHGRLDGITPRLVLQLACEAGGTARVTFNDAAFSYELYVGDGRLLSASRVSRDNVREIGDPVLPGLLGARAGRFEVTRVNDTVQAEFCGSLSVVLAPHIRRARAAGRAVQGPALYEVVRLRFDSDAVAAYRATSPAVVSRLVEKLQDGLAPASLLRSVSAGLLESVLHDLATRGAICSALDAHGNDLVEADVASVFAQLIDVDVRTPAVGDAILPALGAPMVGASSTAEDVDKAVAFAEQLQDRIAESQKPPRAVPLPNRDIVPPVPKTLFQTSQLSMARGREEPEGDHETPYPEVFEFSDVVLGALSRTPVAPSAGRRPAQAAATLLRKEARNVGVDSAVLERSVRTGTPVVPRTQPWVLAQPIPQGALSLPLILEGDSVVAEAAPTGVVDSGIQGVDQTTRRWLEQFRSRARGIREFLTRDPDSETPPLVQAGVVARAEEVAASAQPSPARLEAETSAAPREPAPESTALPPLGDADLKTAPPAGAVEKSALVAHAKVAASALRNVGPALKSGASRVASLGAPLVLGLGAAGGAFMLVSVLARSPDSEAAAPVPALPAVNAVPAVNAASDAVQSPSGDGETLNRDDASRLAELAPPGAAQPVAAADASLRLQSRHAELPAGIEVGPGKGLFEIDTGGKHRIYVEGVFVGRGPVRRVPLPVGTHAVETRLDGHVQRHEVTVVEGKRTRTEAVGVPGTAALR
ncbi:MAG: hypothetical protein RJA70_31 [Pseudomonadota bacterium]|jgi:CheY-like chemotaxis protein